MDQSRAERFARLPQREKDRLLQGMSAEDLEAMKWDWGFWGRPKQQPPEGEWRNWLILAGRGFGKTRTGAEWLKKKIMHEGVRRAAAIAPTSQDVRDVMVEGESGLLRVFPPDWQPEWWPSKNKLEFPNGAVILCYPATEPDRLRGPQFEAAWCDEMAAWDHLSDPYNAWIQLGLGLRLGKRPQALITTTPRPLKLVRRIASDPATVVTTGSTYENRNNLAPDFIKSIEEQFAGTRVGRQEIYAEILDDVPGALWPRDLIEQQRWNSDMGRPPKMKRTVVAVDPAVSNSEDADETGIVVVGVDVNNQGFVIADVSVHGTSDEWGKAVVRAYNDFQADRVVAEVNNGGDLVQKVIQTVDPNVPFKAVRATRGKIKRAEPVSALYEQGRVWHLGMFPQLEDQMSRFTPDEEFEDSPDRADALVWGLTEVILTKRQPKPFKKVSYI